MLRGFLLALAFTNSIFGQNDSLARLSPKPVFYLYDIANQTQEDITTILGPKSSLSPEDAAAAICKNCQKYSYQNDRIIIEYTNDMADRIIIRPEPGIKPEEVPALLGLKFVAPDSISENEMRWIRYGGVREVSGFFEKGGDLKFVLVKVLTN